MLGKYTCVMKYALFFALVLFLQTSCKKCANCTYTDAKTGVISKNEICDSGHIYENEKTTYEKNGWICEEE